MRYYSGVLNEGGLFGERQGWHLPGFDTSGWEQRDLSQGLPGQKAGVGFFITTFNLNIPQDIDAMISFTFGESLGQPYRVYLFVNGWMMGKRVANLGYVARQSFCHFEVRGTECFVKAAGKIPCT
jgi:hypothetical protein